MGQNESVGCCSKSNLIFSAHSYPPHLDVNEGYKKEEHFQPPPPIQSTAESLKMSMMKSRKKFHSEAKLKSLSQNQRPFQKS